ncbi:MAG: PP2C family protein-serine/threonine phosphatase [Terriglobales bacterium]
MLSERWRQFRVYMKRHGLVPTSRLARFTLYLLGVDVFLLLYRGFMRLAHKTPQVDGWIYFIAYVAAFLGCILAFRWVRERLMWALRNRLIVTYMFIGVIPVVLLILMGLLVGTVFVGQFATYVSTSDLQTEIRELHAVNERLASEIATALRHGSAITPDILQKANPQEEMFPNRQVTAWFKGKWYVLGTTENPASAQNPPTPVSLPPADKGGTANLVIDGARTFLRASRELTVNGNKLVVISSVPLDVNLLTRVAEKIGVVSMEAFTKSDNGKQEVPKGTSLKISSSNEELNLEPSGGGPQAMNGAIQSSAPIPPPKNYFDREITFISTVPAMDWNGGADRNILMVVHTRPSLMYERLFRTVGNFVNVVLLVLAAVGIFFGIIELIALFIGVRLTRTITESIYKLYQATRHVNLGDFTHRIKVTRNDQLASLETSFNSMTENIQKLLKEQQEKQRLESELAIAQEVQAQLFPKGVFDIRSLELYGFCAPARTVSGDYYDFIPLGPDRLALAVGDISGKGISAALLMASIHSAVRAYSLERVPMMATAGAGHGGSFVLSAVNEPGFEPEISPSQLCQMLNRQLYHSTAMEKYATMFLGIYDGDNRRLTYCNAGHLPPLLLGSDGDVRRLEHGGSVVGLIDGLSYEEAEVSLRPGDIFIAYSDGMTEPENEFGEFGEQRLIELVKENQHLPLQRIAELAVAAVKDWIGGNEQPDDVTIVLARLR